MSFNFCYDPTQPGWGGKVQPGADALRDVMLAKVPELYDLGIIRDKSRCQKKSSTHCYGRAWDAGTPNASINIKAGDFFVAAAYDLGIQRVIGWGPRSDGTIGYREWDSREGQRYWSRYSGPEHLSHNHVELCWEAAKRLTVPQVAAAFDRYWEGEEDDMAQVPQAEWDEVVKLVKSMDDRIRRVEIRTRLNYDARTIGTDVKKLADMHPPAAPVPDDE